MLGRKPFWMTWNCETWEGEPLKFSSQRILRQSVVRGKKCLAVSARHHHIDPGGFCYIIPTLTQIDFCAKCFGHCKEGSFWLGVFPASQCVTVFGFNTSAYPILSRLMNFSPLLSMFNLCLQVVHQALLHLGNQRITGTAWYKERIFLEFTGGLVLRHLIGIQKAVGSSQGEEQRPQNVKSIGGNMEIFFVPVVFSFAWISQTFRVTQLV